MRVLKDAEFALYKFDTDAQTKLYYHYDKTKKEVSWVKLGEGGVNADLAEAIKAGQVTAGTTGTDGKVAFKGLAAGTYYLQETKAPEGFNLMTEAQEVIITEDGTQRDNIVKVPNASGTELPETGGIGSTIFYVVGAAMILAGVMLLMRKRVK